MKGAQVVAISTDDRQTLAAFRKKLAAPFPFLSDPGGKVSTVYAGLTGSGTAKRTTVVVGEDGKIRSVTEGIAAVFPEGDIASCPLRGHQ